MEYVLIQQKDFTLPPYKWMDDDWALLTAKKNDGTINTMTISWGGFEIIWNRSVVSVMIRPHRFTKEFVDESLKFSLSFFNHEKYKKALSYLGAVSGKEVPDKISKTNLTLDEDNGVPFFKEAHTIINAKVIFSQVLTPEHFIDKTIESHYKNKDYHHLYFGEITSIKRKKTV